MENYNASEMWGLDNLKQRNQDFSDDASMSLRDQYVQNGLERDDLNS